MAIAGENQTQGFAESDLEDTRDYSHFAHSSAGPNLPPVEFKIEDIKDNASPEELILAALEERAVETALHEDSSFGLVVIPAEKSLHGYKYALSSSGHNIRFSPHSYTIFDAIIVQESCGTEAPGLSHPAFNPRSDHYETYAPLRRNLAILRNYLMTLYLPTNNKVNQATLQAMARKLGKALRIETRKQSWIERIIRALRQLILKQAPMPQASRFLALANTPDRGIAFMYHYLLEQQPSMTIADVPASQLPKNWILFPLEETPFSASNMVDYSDATRMGQIGAALELVANRLGSVDKLTSKDKEISVEHAREILRKLRIISGETQGEKQYDQMDFRNNDAQGMLQSALNFQSAVADLAKDEPNILKDPLVIQASQAITSLSSRVRHEEKIMLRQENRAPSHTTQQERQRQHEQRQQEQQQKTGRSRGRPDRQRSSDAAHSMRRHIHHLEEGLQHVLEMRRKQYEKAMRKASLSYQISKQDKLQKTLSDGMSTMSRPKIHQVSLNDSDLMENIKKLNEKEPDEIKKTKSGGQSLGPK